MDEHVFKKRDDGSLEFVGDFEGLYRANPDPWQQSGAGDDEMAAYYSRSRARLCMLHSFLRPVEGGQHFDIGCGLGHSTAHLAREVGGSWEGCDVSLTAITKAQAAYPHLSFGHCTILERIAPNLADTVVLNELFWYVLHDLQRALANAAEMLVPGGVLIISQGFLPPEQQRYARDVALGIEGGVTAICLAADRIPDLSLTLMSIDHYRPRCRLDHVVLAFTKATA